MSVSVVITAYKEAHVVGDAIRSVLAQTRPPEQIIVIDDGSIDATPSVVQQFAGVEYHWQFNAGVAAARNAGLALVQTPYVLFLDADDVLYPEALERGLAVIQADPALGLVYGGYTEVAVNGERKTHPIQEFPNAYEKLLGWNYVGMPSTIIYDVEKIRDVGGFASKLTGCEDWDLLLTMSRLHPIKAYHYTAGEYRRRKGSLSKKDPLAFMDRAHDVLRRQQGLNPVEEAAKQDGWSAVTRVYSEVAAWMVVELLRHGRVRQATSLAIETRRRYPQFPRQVGGVFRHLAGRLTKTIPGPSAA